MKSSHLYFVERWAVGTSSRGFTLIESLVAISILLAIATYPLVQLGESLRQGRQAEDTIAATLLAQEGVEVARSVRDSARIDVLTGGDNGEFVALSALCGPGTDGCIIDPFAVVASSRLRPCTGTCAPLWYNASTGRYGHEVSSGWQPSRYTRTVSVESVPGNTDELAVTSVVTWQTQSGQDRTVRAREHVFRFQD